MSQQPKSLAERMAGNAPMTIASSPKAPRSPRYNAKAEIEDLNQKLENMEAGLHESLCAQMAEFESNNEKPGKEYTIINPEYLWPLIAKRNGALRNFMLKAKKVEAGCQRDSVLDQLCLIIMEVMNDE